VFSFARVRSGSWRPPLVATAVFTALTAVITWPQPLVLATAAADHPDIYFNLWRLRWTAHALATSPGQLFEGNIFYPAHNTLALSDAILLEGVIGAPLFWIGLPPLLVHNLLLLGAIAASGVGMFVLAEHLTGSRAGAFAAGIVYAFAPYRIDHIMHMELQWAMWIPWAFWSLQRTLETRRVKYGVLTGAFMALQMLSCIYYGIFLALLLPLAGLLQLLAMPKSEAPRILGALLLGAILLAVVSGLYARPYLGNSLRVGLRSASETTMFSAKPRDYLAATETNLLYGEPLRGRPERRLLPGVVAVLAALVGLLLVAPAPWTVAYAIGGVAAFELSLGMYGLIYPDLYSQLGLLQGLRAPARASLLCLMFLAALAARGCAAIEGLLPANLRKLVPGVVIPALLLEYWVAPLPLLPYPNSAPPVYAWLSQQPRGLVAEFPVPQVTTLPGREPAYAYMSTFHWKPLLNGYSGYFPPSYLNHLVGLKDFPARSAIDRLRRTGVTYLVLHSTAYDTAVFKQLLETLTESGLVVVAAYPDGWDQAVVFRVV
jgi:hypothetical protein